MTRTRIKTGISIAALFTAGLNTTMAASECDVIFPVGGTVGGTPGAVAEYQGELFVLGTFSSADGLSANGLIRFDGKSWQQVAHGVGIGSLYYGDNHLLEYEGKLILTGGNVNPLDADGQDLPVPGVLTWDGESWGSIGEQACGFTLASGVYQGDLVIGFYDSNDAGCEHPEYGFDDPIRGVARWDGEHWEQLGDTSDFDHVTALIEFEGDLIAGDFSGVVRRWDGESWQVIGEADNRVYVLEILDGDLIVGGRFDEIDGTIVNGIARLQDGVWTDMDGGFSSSGALRVSALTMYNGQLHAGGRFNNASGNSAFNVARWTGEAWESIGPSPDGWVLDLTEYQGMLAGCGGFQQVSGPEIGEVIARRTFAHIGCEITGACCVDGGCVELSAEDCLAAGGTYHGDQSICAKVSCPPYCPADLNNDGTVDVLDLLMLLNNWGVCPDKSAQ